MWNNALMYSTQQVTHALLSRPVLPAGAKAFERVSAAIAVRTALGSRASVKTVMFIVPEPGQHTALQIGAALLVGNHAHANGGYMLPPDEVRPLFKGDLLLVTQALTATKSELEKLPIGPYNRLGDLWDVVSLSRYTGPKNGDRPRVCLANPGWAQTLTAGRRFGAVVIDASHPRTLSVLPELVRSAAGCSAIRLIVAPPAAREVLAQCGYPEHTTVWLWDGQAQADAAYVVDVAPDRPEHSSRTVWVTEDDAELSDKLAALHTQLLGVRRAAEGKEYPGFALAWSIYLRLRGLAAPLTDVDELAIHSWSGPLRRRVEALAGVQGYGLPLWDSTWPAIVAAVREVYEALLRRREPAKYWALASRLEDLLRSHDRHVRVVCSSETEATVLQLSLVELVDAVGSALLDGRLELVSPGQEARLVASGSLCHTVLLTQRPVKYRYLDVCPSMPVDVIAYPYEAKLERAAYERAELYVKELGGTESRLMFLDRLGLRPPKTKVGAAAPAKRPAFCVCSATSGRQIEQVILAQQSSSLDLESLVDVAGDASSLVPNGSHGVSATATGDFVEVAFKGGRTQRYPDAYDVDVFFFASEEIKRMAVSELQPGWHVITFVDGQYDALFKRLVDAVEERLPPKERVALELWRKAKQRLSSHFPNRTELHSRLVQNGSNISYSVLISCLRDGEDPQLAPRHFEEFEGLAQIAGVPAALIKPTFACIQRTRGRNRAAGRKLKAFLRAAVSGGDSDDALESARAIDSALGDLLAAVEVLEVSTTRKIKRSTT